MPRRISMQDSTQVAAQAAAELEAWLRTLPQTLGVVNVEENPDYQQIDVDLIWTTQKRTYTVEIKADRWHKTGNFFFETISNQEKGTPGCFLYTKADLIFYYFLEIKRLHILPMPATRTWFLAHQERFPKRSTTTPIGSEEYYTTVGRLVPIEVVYQEVDGVRQYEVEIE